ncbi:MAG: YncE family protein [Planctomycetota bacterium]
MTIKAVGALGATFVLAGWISGVLGGDGGRSVNPANPADRASPETSSRPFLPISVGTGAPETGESGARGQLEEGILLVALKQAGRLMVVDAVSGDVRRSVDLRGPGAEVGRSVGPHEVAVSRDGRTAVVSLYGAKDPGHELVFVSLPEGRISGRLGLDGYSRPHGLVFLGEGEAERLLVTAEVQQSLLVIDPMSHAVESAIETKQWGSHMVAALDADRAYVSNVASASVSVLNIASGELEAIISTGNGAEGIAVRPGGGEVWVANNQANNVSVIDGTTLSVTRYVACPNVPIRVVFTPDGSKALVTSAGTGELVVFDAGSYEELGRVDLLSEEHYDGTHPQLGSSPVPVGVVPSASGRLAYVSNMAGGYVSVVDLESLEVLRVFDLGDDAGPDGIAFVAG